MASRICPTVINCDCSNFPWANLSAELAEPYVFVSPHIIIRNPPLGRIFSQFGCKRWCYSSVSQAEADACAIAQATECATVITTDPPIVVDPPDPPVGFPTVSVFASEASTSFGGDPGVFLLSRSGSTSQPLAVQFTLSGSAQNGVDYDTVPYAVTIDAGDSDVEVIIVPMDTGEIIQKEVILTVLAGSNYSPGAKSRDSIAIVLQYEVAWNDPPRAIDPPLAETDEECPWPNAYYTSQPFGCRMCDSGDYDPYRWPLGGEGVPNDQNSQVTQYNHHVYVTMEDHERVLLRQAVNGGETGKHVKMTVSFTLPGGIREITSVNEDTGETDTVNSFNRLELGMNDNPCEVFAFDAQPQIYVNESLGAALGTAIFEFDIGIGIDAYACLQANSATQGFGPCALDLLTEITNLP